MVAVPLLLSCCACIRFGALFSIFSPAELLPLLVTYMCLRFRGCPIVLDIELSVSARYHKTRVLQRAQQQRAAACGINF